ncbi:MAG: sugar ABC transporter permease, partial [Bombilactobacillus sp.]|nr:sugar ABC transporter permease [Bombilactobacillus sp.]
MFKKKKHAAVKATFREVWSKGSIATKLSFFIMGSNALENKQWVKGLTLLLAEVAFIIWFIFSGISAISMLTTLGENK